MIGSYYYCSFSPTAKAANTTYSDMQDAMRAAQMSDAEASVEVEKYREYGYSEEQLETIKADLKNGIDVSGYTQKEQTVEYFGTYREIVIKKYDEIINTEKNLSAGAIISVAMIFACISLFAIEKITRLKLYKREMGQSINEAKVVEKISQKNFWNEKAITRSVIILGIFVINTSLSIVGYDATFPVDGIPIYMICVGYAWLCSGLRDKPSLEDLDLSVVVSIVLLIATIMLAVFFPVTAKTMFELREFCDF